MDTNYPSNSYNQRNKEEPNQEERHLEPVVSHDVQVRKKNIAQKFAKAFIAEDLNSVKSYVITDLLIPGIKKMFLSSLEMLLNGKGYSGSKKDKQVTSISYRDYYEKEQKQSESARNPYLDFDDIIFTERGDAEYVLDQMRDVLKKYRVVHVSDMYELSR